MSFKSKAEVFVKVKVTGIKAVQDVFDSIIKPFERAEILEKICKKAAQPIASDYRKKAKSHDATGNLAKSTKIRGKRYKYAAIAITGPEQTGSKGATAKTASGNHAWLVEFGSHGRRKPDSADKKTYINVHKSINGKMTVHRKLENADKFQARSRGFYFLMCSYFEPTRLARRGKGYTHDFLPAGADGNPNIHPYTLHPGETYGAMPAYHLMETTIVARAADVTARLKAGLIDAINEKLSKSMSGAP